MSDYVNANFYGSLNASWHENFSAQIGDIDGGTKGGSGAIRGAHSIDAIHHNIVATIFGSVVCTAMSIDTPVAREER